MVGAKAAYRLLEQSDVSYERVTAPHTQRVRADCRRGGEYLLVEDTTSLDFTAHQAAQDMGRIGDDGERGLHVHTTLALKIERWNERHEPEVTVEGLFDQRWWARTMPTVGRKEKKRKRLNRPRESQRWAAVVDQMGVPPDGVQWTFMADRESDIYETFERCQRRRWRFIVRANQPRALAAQGGSVFAAVGKGSELGRFCVDLRARPGQASRAAQVAVRTCTVLLRGPWRPGGQLEPLTVNVVEAREIGAPPGVEPIRWVLLTNWPSQTFEQAMRAIKAYTRRWLIEEYHKALKTGTGIQDSQLTTAQRITALLGILAVVAGPLLNMKLLAATRPDEPLEPEQIGPEGLAILEAQYGRPTGGWTNLSALTAIARMGGFLARKGDGNPGWITIWRGLRQLMLMAQGYDLAQGAKCGQRQGRKPTATIVPALRACISWRCSIGPCPEICASAFLGSFDMSIDAIRNGVRLVHGKARLLIRCWGCAFRKGRGMSALALIARTRPFLRVLAFVVLTLAATSFCQASIVNPSFETGDTAGWSNVSNMHVASGGGTDGSHYLTADVAWTSQGGGDIIDYYWQSKATQTIVVPAGATTFSIDIRQTGILPPAFDCFVMLAGSVGSDYVGVAVMKIGNPGIILSDHAQPGAGMPLDNGFMRYSIDVTGYEKYPSLALTIQSDAHLRYTFPQDFHLPDWPIELSVDNIQFTPEPASLVMMVSMALPLVLRRRKGLTDR